MTTQTVAERCRHRFPIFERLVYANSCSQGALSDAVRAAYDAYLTDWDDRGAPWDYWVERSETARAAFARLVNAAPDGRRGDDLGLGGRLGRRERARLRAAAARRRQRLRVPDRRADLARAGAARRRGRPRAGRRLGDPARALRRGDRRADGARRRDRGLLPQRRPAADRGDRRARARARRARAARRLPGGGHVPARRRGARRRLPRGGRAQVPARVGRARVPLVPARPRRAADADADGLVRRPRHLRDGHPRLLAVADRDALPVGDAAGARDLRRHRRDGADGGDRRSRRRAST